MPEPPEVLMRRIAAGDRGALGELYSQFQASVFRFFSLMTPSRHAAEEGVQEVFLRVWRSAPAWRPSAKFTTWLFALARNYWLNECARAGARTGSLDAPGAADVLPDARQAPPAARAEQDEAAVQVRNALARLPEHERIALILAQYENLSYAEIADVLDIPVGTVKSRIAKASGRLRDWLRPYWEGGRK